MKITADSKAYEFACHSKACAPPPAGSGGSNPGSGKVRGISKDSRPAHTHSPFKSAHDAYKTMKALGEKAKSGPLSDYERMQHGWAISHSYGGGPRQQSSRRVTIKIPSKMPGGFKSAEHARTVMNQLSRKKDRTPIEEATLKAAVARSQASGKTRPTG